MSGRCPVCGTPPDDAAARCERCDTAYHPACKEWAGGCAIYGCGATPSDVALEPMPAGEAAVTSSRPPLPEGSYIDLLLGGESEPSARSLFFVLAVLVGLNPIKPDLGLFLVALIAALPFWLLRRTTRIDTAAGLVVHERRLGPILLGRRTRPLAEFHRLEVWDDHDGVRLVLVSESRGATEIASDLGVARAERLEPQAARARLLALARSLRAHSSLPVTEALRVDASALAKRQESLRLVHASHASQLRLLVAAPLAGAAWAATEGGTAMFFAPLCLTVALIALVVRARKLSRAMSGAPAATSFVEVERLLRDRHPGAAGTALELTCVAALAALAKTAGAGEGSFLFPEIGLAVSFHGWAMAWYAGRLLSRSPDGAAALTLTGGQPAAAQALTGGQPAAALPAGRDSGAPLPAPRPEATVALANLPPLDEVAPLPGAAHDEINLVDRIFRGPGLSLALLTPLALPLLALPFNALLLSVVALAALTGSIQLRVLRMARLHRTGQHRRLLVQTESLGGALLGGLFREDVCVFRVAALISLDRLDEALEVTRQRAGFSGKPRAIALLDWSEAKVLLARGDAVAARDTYERIPTEILGGLYECELHRDRALARLAAGDVAGASADVEHALCVRGVATVAVSCQSLRAAVALVEGGHAETAHAQSLTAVAAHALHVSYRAQALLTHAAALLALDHCEPVALAILDRLGAPGMRLTRVERGEQAALRALALRRCGRLSEAEEQTEAARALPSTPGLELLLARLDPGASRTRRTASPTWTT